MFTHVYWCLPMFTDVYRYLSLFTHVYWCLQIFTLVYPRLLMFTLVYCLVYWCLPLFTDVYPCLLDLPHMYLFKPMFTLVYLCFLFYLIFTKVSFYLPCAHVYLILPYVCLCFLIVCPSLSALFYISMLQCETQLFTCIACLMLVSVIMFTLFTKLQKSCLNCMSYILTLLTFPHETSEHNWSFSIAWLHFSVLLAAVLVHILIAVILIDDWMLNVQATITAILKCISVPHNYSRCIYNYFSQYCIVCMWQYCMSTIQADLQ